MSDSRTSVEPPAAPRRKSRLPWIAILLGAAILVAGGGYLFYRTVSAQSQLSTALAEADRLDPRWRLESVEADRAVVPDAENSVTPIIAAHKAMPKSWPFWDAPQPFNPNEPPEADAKRKGLADSFHDLEPQRQLNDEQITALRTEMARAADALAEARKLTDLTSGRYAIKYSADWIGTLLPDLQDAREAAALLTDDSMLRAQEKDADGALASCRAALNAGRSVGDEPSLISQLVRIACGSIAVRQAERVLAQGEPSESELKLFQDLLEDEQSAPLLLFALRGERAGMDRLMEGIQTGKVKVSAKDLDMTAGLAGQRAPSLAEDLTVWTPGFREYQRAAMLRYMNRAVELAKLPPEKRHGEFQKLEATIKEQPVLVRLLVPSLIKVSDACQRNQALLRCAVAATAAERYRRARGQWPDSLEALKDGGYVKATLSDPYDGHPLRWRRLDDGLVIYTLGPDGEDNGGKMDRQNPNSPGTDIGFRLWDVDARRQPPAPAKPPAGQEDRDMP